MLLWVFPILKDRFRISKHTQTKGANMNKLSAVEARNQAGKFYIKGILVFIGLFGTISVCGWFLTSLNF